MMEWSYGRYCHGIGVGIYSSSGSNRCMSFKDVLVQRFAYIPTEKVLYFVPQNNRVKCNKLLIKWTKTKADTFSQYFWSDYPFRHVGRDGVTLSLSPFSSLQMFCNNIRAIIATGLFIMTFGYRTNCGAKVCNWKPFFLYLIRIMLVCWWRTEFGLNNGYWVIVCIAWAMDMWPNWCEMFHESLPNTLSDSQSILVGRSSARNHLRMMVNSTPCNANNDPCAQAYSRAQRTFFSLIWALSWSAEHQTNPAHILSQNGRGRGAGYFFPCLVFQVKFNEIGLEARVKHTQRFLSNNCVKVALRATDKQLAYTEIKMRVYRISVCRSPSPNAHRSRFNTMCYTVLAPE